MRGAREKKYLVAGIAVVSAIIVLIIAGVVALIAQGPLSQQEARVEVSSPAPTSSIAATAEPSVSPELIVADGTCVDPSSVDRSDPDKVAEAVMSISFCYDSVLDATTTDAMRRAEPLMSENMRSLLVDNGRNALSSQFLEAAKGRGYSFVDVVSVGSDAHGAEHGSGNYQVTKMATWKWKSRDVKGTMDGGYAVWTMTLIQDESGNWVLDSYQLGAFQPAF